MSYRAESGLVCNTQRTSDAYFLLTVASTSSKRVSGNLPAVLNMAVPLSPVTRYCIESVEPCRLCSCTYARHRLQVFKDLRFSRTPCNYACDHIHLDRQRSTRIRSVNNSRHIPTTKVKIYITPFSHWNV